MYNSSYRFMPIILKLHMCFGHGLKMCTWFRYNHQLIFVIFFRNLNFVIFQVSLLSTYLCRQLVPCEDSFTLSVLPTVCVCVCVCVCLCVCVETF